MDNAQHNLVDLGNSPESPRDHNILLSGQIQCGNLRGKSWNSKICKILMRSQSAKQSESPLKFWGYAIDLENKYQFVIFPQNTIFCSLSKYSHKVKVVHFISNFYFASSPNISIVIKGYLDVIGGFFLHCGSHWIVHWMTFLES